MELIRRADRLWRASRASAGAGLRAGRDWPAAALLTGALATVFFFSGYDRGQFYRAEQHDTVSGNYLAVAANLSPEHGFLQFYGRYIDHAGGEPTYAPYHRFPPLGYVLIKLAGLPFGDDLPARLYAARMLMLAFFCGAALLAFFSVRQLTGERAVPLTATLLAFSSYPLLYYSDMVAIEGVMDLFAVMLAFHGVAVHCAVRPGPREGGRAASTSGGRRRGVTQLYAKMCAAPLLGWHVYGLLLPLLLVVLPHAVCTRDWRRLRLYALLGVAVVAVGLVMIALNLVREHHSLDGATPFFELPSLRSMLNRTGVAPYDDVNHLGWLALIELQFHRIGGATLPWALAQSHGLVAGLSHWIGGACVAAALAAICLPGVRHRAAWAALAFCGWGWTLLAADSAGAHRYEVLFHVGAPLAACALLLTRLRAFAATRRSRAEALVNVASVAVGFVLFVLSSWMMGRVGVDARTWERKQALMADVREIRRHIGGKVVHVPWAVLEEKVVTLVDLAGSVLALDSTVAADFVLATDPRSPVFPPTDARGATLPASPSFTLLTPRNRVLFLFEYDPVVYRAALAAARGAYERLADEERPAIESRFDVHHVGNALLYVGEGESCAVHASDRGALLGMRGRRFFLHVHPVDVNDLQPGRRRFGFASLDFARDTSWMRDGRCYALRFLPTFPIGRIRTGQFVRGHRYHNVWDESFLPAGGAGERDAAGEYQRMAAREPAARSTWDVHVLRGAGELALLKAPCASGDVAARFFVHVVPVDASVLSAARGGRRYDNLDFDFLDRGGARAEGKCVVRVRLPDYDIAAVRAGQYRGAAELWGVELPMPAASPQ